MKEPTQILHLHLRFEYFDQIKAGTKTEEFRACTPFNDRLMARRPFAEIRLYRGYPKTGDMENTLVRPWKGFQIRTITHPHFNNQPTRVYAITVN